MTQEYIQPMQINSSAKQKDYEAQVHDLQKQVVIKKLRGSQANFLKDKAILQQKVELLELQVKELRERLTL